MPHMTAVVVTGENLYFGTCHTCIPPRDLNEPTSDLSVAEEACRQHELDTEHLTGPDAYRSGPYED